jgi:TetR/AcrR family transcriptional regulator, transcriptional repressor of aconitase
MTRGDRKSLRRRQILAAALECFLQYGYAKTSLDDVARQAEVSRLLLYVYFKDKKDLFVSLIMEVLDETHEMSKQALRSAVPAREKLQRIVELWSVELYAKAAGTPHGHELLDEGMRAWEEIRPKYKDILPRLISGFVGGHDAAELIMLSIKGLESDRPSLPVLRRRVRLLAELGWRNGGLQA